MTAKRSFQQQLSTEKNGEFDQTTEDVKMPTNKQFRATLYYTGDEIEMPLGT